MNDKKKTAIWKSREMTFQREKQLGMFKEQSRGQCDWIEGREDERERKIKLLTFGRKELEVRNVWADCFSLF